MQGEKETGKDERKSEEKEAEEPDRTITLKKRRAYGKW